MTVGVQAATDRAGETAPLLMKRNQPSRKRRRRQRGSVLVETALTMPVVFLLIFGLIETSFMLQDHLALRATAQDAARTATVLGGDLDADFRILETALETGAPLKEGAIIKIVVYRATTATSPVPPACPIASQDSVTTQCNLYIPSDFARPSADFGCTPPLSPDLSWCPNERIAVQSPANGGPPDFVGIHVELRRDTITGLFGDSQQMSATYVLRVEPRDL
jgi:hypothetical protein